MVFVPITADSVSPASATASRSWTSGIENVIPSRPASMYACACSAISYGSPMNASARARSLSGARSSTGANFVSAASWVAPM